MATIEIRDDRSDRETRLRDNKIPPRGGVRKRDTSWPKWARDERMSGSSRAAGEEFLRYFIKIIWKTRSIKKKEEEVPRPRSRCGGEAAFIDKLE